ncbi:MAG TPA: MOSC domain-containing protein, partial [Candidatus Polarisedimenticolia bacterium]|nr:MOSC domain-containing protein [Candidatus Polarisedimenticolia bacterium]
TREPAHNSSRVKAEAYWPDLEGLDHRDKVTDFELPTGTFFDCATIHLLTTATLEGLRQAYPQGRFEVQRFRPNFVVEPVGGERAFAEAFWIGHILAVGDQVRLSITGPCGRCVMTTLAQGDLPADTGILKTVVQQSKGRLGVYASVLQGGTIRHGDRVKLIAA